MAGPIDMMPPADDTGRRSPLRRIVGAILTIGVVVAVFAGLIPRVADYEELGNVLGRLRPGELLGLAAASIWFLTAYWFVLMAALPSLRLLEAGVNHSAGTAVTNTLPAGGAVAVALNYSIYLSWGFTPAAITAGLLSAGIWDNLAKFGLPAVALGLLAMRADSSVTSIAGPVLGIGLVVAAVVILVSLLRSETAAMRIGSAVGAVANRVRRIAHRPPMDAVEMVVDLRGTIVGLIGRRWRPLTIATVANHLAMFTVLYTALRVVGVGPDDLDLLRIVAGFSIARLLSGVPITPGGLGVVDAGYVAALTVGVPEEGRAAIVAGILLFRALTFVPPILVGVVAWSFWRLNRSLRRNWRSERRGEQA